MSTAPLTCSAKSMVPLWILARRVAAGTAVGYRFIPRGTAPMRRDLPGLRAACPGPDVRGTATFAAAAPDPAHHGQRAAHHAHHGETDQEPLHYVALRQLQDPASHEQRQHTQRGETEHPRRADDREQPPAGILQRRSCHDKWGEGEWRRRDGCQHQRPCGILRYLALDVIEAARRQVLLEPSLTRSTKDQIH